MKDMIIEVTDLTKSYNRKRVVKKINFSVQKGEIFGILGPNGASKSTTLEMIVIEIGRASCRERV